jgi:MSHA pilin protein MshD
MSANRCQRGLTLIELIMFIVIVGVALAGVLTVLNHTTRHSADPLIRKQALAIAEAILEEVMLQPFTWCDPDDTNAATATSAAACTGGAAGANNESRSPLGPETGEARGTFDNVSDYQGLSTATNIAGNATAPYIAPYTATVTIVEEALNGIAATESLRITVTVVAGSETIQMEGYRTRHSPNLLP